MSFKLTMLSNKYLPKTYFFWLMSLFLMDIVCAEKTVVAFQVAPLDEVVISASGYEQKIFDTAASINLINSNQIHNGQEENNLSESLARVPGIFALNRQNYAQDLLISSRGFGANSTFGTRGMKIFVDGIPGTVADGQGQISHIDLASADRIEVMRGPFSVKYGNSSGGVIQVFTQDGQRKKELMPYLELGSYSLHKEGVKTSGIENNIGYVMDVGQLHWGGYRDNSSTNKRNANAKLNFKYSEDTAITLVANNVSLQAQDPLGLTASQVATNSRQAGTSALSQNTRKSVEQTQLGSTIDVRINADNHLITTPYIGQRRTIQYLAAGANGVIDLARTFYGVDNKWVHLNQVFDVPVTIVGGLDLNENDDHRLTYTNSSGISTGPATQDYSMSAKNFDQYLQTDFRLTERLALNAGVRRSQTNLSSTSNNTLNTSSGSRAYQAFTNMLSAQYYVTENANIYLSYGSSFDTPTLNQVTYNSAFSGSNFSLAAAKTQQVELGLKAKFSQSIQGNLALFNANTTNDIVVGASSLGRTSFTNAPKTNRQGIEASTTISLPYHFQWNLAYTLLNANVKESYTYTNVTPYTVLSGNRIPGVPNQKLFSELMWTEAKKLAEIGAETMINGPIAVNDINSSSVAGGYAVMNLRGVLRQSLSSGWTITEFVRLNNIFNRNYIGSVIVNQISSQFYESAPGRNWIVGAKASYQF